MSNTKRMSDPMNIIQEILLIMLHYLSYLLLLPALSVYTFLSPAYAVTPISLYTSYAGNYNFLSTGGSLRTNKEAIPFIFGDTNACLVGPTSSASLSDAVIDPAAPVLTGLPAGATVVAAHLYWAGSYSPLATDPASNGTAPDNNVTLDGAPVAASRTFTEVFAHTWPVNPTNYDFFGGYADVTALVSAKGNGIYTFGGLTVNTAGNHCASYGVLAGWALHVIYKHPTEDFRVINLFDGFQIYRGSSISLTPNNFVVPAAPINGKIGLTTWEGDESNSAALGAFVEDLLISIFPSTIPTLSLLDTINPTNNQFNSTINATNPTQPLVLNGTPAPYGVDIDQYDISATLGAGQTSSNTIYSSGADLVILSSEIFSATNTPVADLSITKTHTGDFGFNINNDYTITVSNHGPNTATGAITVVDTLPAGLNYVSASGSGWSCAFAGTLSCSHPGSLANGVSLPSITLTVNTSAPAGSSVTNSATVSGVLFDNIAANNTATDLTNIILMPNLSVSKTANAVTATPGAAINYTVTITNTGLGSALTVNQDDNLSPYSSFGIECMPGGQTVVFTDGIPSSTLTAGTLEFSNDDGVTYTYMPPALGGTVACAYDPNITNFRLPMIGTMPTNGTYQLGYQVQVK